MSVISIGGGPHPQARIVAVSELDTSGNLLNSVTFEIRDGSDILMSGLTKLSYARALLPLVQSGE
jgi:hypothetical protein